MPKFELNKRNNLYLAISRYLSLSKYSSFTLPLLLVPALTTASETTEKWICGADAGEQWVCTQKAVAGRNYARPYHSENEPRHDDEGPVVRRSKNLDWVEEQYLTDTEKAAMPSGCCGAYIEPKRDYPDAKLKPDEAPLRVAAASTEVLGNDVARLEGGVQLTQGYRQVRGNSATLDQLNRNAEIIGDVQFREPGLLIQGESAKVNLDTKQVEIEDITFLFHEAGARGKAERLERSSEGVFYINNATYTTCEPGSDNWLLDTGSLQINPENNMATAKNVKLKIKGIPVLYMPWLTFPVGDKRTTGLLFPHFELSDDNGVDYGQPIYLNLAPNYDMTITPRYLQERGAALEIEGRHLSHTTETVIGGSFLADDDGGDDPDDITKPYEGKDRWVAQVEHTGGFGKRWNTAIDYTEASDADYFRDLGTATLQTSSRTHLTQKAEVGYQLNHWELSVSSHQFQHLNNGPLASDDYQVLPRVNANGYYRMGNFVATLNNEFASFDHDQNVVTGDRIHIDYNVSWDKRWTWGFFNPKFSTKYIAYDLTNTGLAEDSPSATIPVVSFDSGVHFERDTSWIGNYIQTFEPRLYGLYVDFEDQSAFPEFDTTERTFSYDQLFRDNRFTGGDRVGDAQQVSIGLTSRLLRANDGKEVFRVSLGQAYYLDDRQVTLPSSTTPLITNQSAYAGELAFSLGENWRFNSSLLFNEDDGVIDKGSVYLGYQGEDNKLFNVGYRYNRKLPRFNSLESRFIDTSIEQADLSAYLPLFGNWNAVARWNYDFTNSRELETFAGIEYNSCCWRVSVLARKWVDQNDNLLIPEEQLEEDSGLFLQIQFKGLGGTSKKVDNILTDGIIGYEIND